jgi:hypothetical protein
MSRLLFCAAAIVGVGWAGLAPAMVSSLGLPGLSGSKVNTTLVEQVGYWQRQFRRYGYPAPYAYYPPTAYGYYPPPAAYAYPPPVYGYQPAPPAYAVPQYPPPPAADGNHPSAEGDYVYPPANGDYPPAEGDYGDHPADGS